jgi:hypothetical protein
MAKLSVCILLIAFTLQGCRLIAAYAMSKEEITFKKETKIGKYNLSLTKRCGWAGFPFLQYDLEKKNLFGRYRSKINLTVSPIDTVNCEIDFYEDGAIKYKVDKCNKKVLITP